MRGSRRGFFFREIGEINFSGRNRGVEVFSELLISFRWSGCIFMDILIFSGRMVESRFYRAPTPKNNDRGCIPWVHFFHIGVFSATKKYSLNK